MSTTISSYEQQAAQFLHNCHTTISFKFKEHGIYFSDETFTRDVWWVTLKNARHRYRFTFGQSQARQGIKPTTYDILACVEKYDPGTFEDFCSNMGYDTDSRRAEKTYKAVVKEWQNIRTLFTSEELEQLQEIQ